MDRANGTGFGKAAALLGTNLRRWRRARALSLKQVAVEVGVSVSIISAWERGRRFPTSAHLDSLAAHTGLPVCRLFCAGDAKCPHHDGP